MKQSSSQSPAKDAAPLAPAIRETIVVKAPSVQVVVPPKTQSLFDPAMYASGIPGALIAIAGFWVVHSLSRRRDKEKRLLDLCQLAIELSEQAAMTASAAWTASKGPKRQELINKAKQEFQTLGVAVTRVKAAATSVARRGTMLEAARALSFKVMWTRKDVDLAVELKNFRVAALHDPFDDPQRLPDQSAVAEIRIELVKFSYALDRAVMRCVP